MNQISTVWVEAKGAEGVARSQMTRGVPRACARAASAFWMREESTRCCRAAAIACWSREASALAIAASSSFGAFTYAGGGRGCMASG